MRNTPFSFPQEASGQTSSARRTEVSVGGEGWDSGAEGGEFAMKKS